MSKWKSALTILALSFAGAFVGYEGGRSYCLAQLNRGRLYDEASHIPPEIADGSAYGNLWTQWGTLLGLLIGIAFLALWKVWWYHEPPDVRRRKTRQ